MRRFSLLRQGGMTILEMTCATSVAAAMLAAGYAVTAGMQKATAGSTKRNALSSRAAEVTDAMARELCIAGMRAEDANGNGVIDADEDLDRNGRLDSDWNVADGATVSAVRPEPRPGSRPRPGYLACPAERVPAAVGAGPPGSRRILGAGVAIAFAGVRIGRPSSATPQPPSAARAAACL